MYGIVQRYLQVKIGVNVPSSASSTWSPRDTRNWFISVD